MDGRTGIIYQYHDTAVTMPDPLLVRAFGETTYDSLKYANAVQNWYRGVFIGGVMGVITLLIPILTIEARYRVGQLWDSAFQQKTTSTILGSNSQPTNVVVPSETLSPSPTPKPPFPTLENKQLNEQLLSKLQPVDYSFAVIVPKLGINSRVIENVDPADETAYRSALKLGAAHAKGSYVPGDNGRTYIFAHSTDYAWNMTRFNAIFYLLRELETGDMVYIVYDGTVFPYRVTDKKIVDPGDTFYLKPQSGEEELLLQTCWPPGTSLKRLLIFAKPDPEASAVDVPVSPTVDENTAL